MPRKPIEHTPSEPQIERAVLGAMITEPACIEKVLRLLTTKDFSQTKNQIVFKAIAELRGKGMDPDVVTLAATIKHGEGLEKIGGPAYLAEILSDFVSSGFLDQHIEQLTDLSQRRRVINAANSVKDAAQSYATIEEILDAALWAANEAKPRDTSGAAVLAGDELKARPEAHSAHWEGMRSLTGISTGIPRLDELTMGYQPGEMVVVAARPSVGKTAFALFSLLAAARQGKSVALASIEMSREAIIERLTAQISRIDSMVLRRGGLDSGYLTRAIGAQAELCNVRFFIDDRGVQRVTDIRASAELLCDRDPISILGIDYVQNISPHIRRTNRNEEVTIISREIKAMAKDLRVPVLALSQLSRPPKGSETRRPYLSDLRDSGSLEQDADVVLMLHDIGRQGGKAGEFEHVELIIAKQRNGPIGTIDLRYRREIGTFEELR